MDALRPSDEPILCSMLLKKSPKGLAGLKAWQPRYFMLYEDRIVYKKDQQSPILGDIRLGFVLSASLSAQRSDNRFDIILISDDRTFSLKAATKELAIEWVGKINRQVSLVNLELANAGADKQTLIKAVGSGGQGTISNKRQGTLKFWKNPSDIVSAVRLFSDSRSDTFSEESKLEPSVTYMSAEDLQERSKSTSKYRRTSSGRSLTRPDVGTQGSLSAIPAALDSSFSNSSNRYAFRDYVLCDLMGDGPFGKIYRAKDPKDNYKIMQVVKKNSSSFERGSKSIENLKGMIYPFLIRQETSGEDSENDTVWAVLSYAHSGPLFAFMRRFKRLNEEIVTFIAAEVALAIGFAHSQDRVVRNLASENVWIDQDGHIMVCDFDMTPKTAASPQSGLTTEFTTPETILGETETNSADWWRLGVFVYEIAVGLPPFRGLDPSELKEKILECDLRFPPYISSETKHFINALLRKDAKLRLGSKHDVVEIQEHPFFKKVEWRILEKKSKEAVPLGLISLMEQMWSDSRLSPMVGSVRGPKKSGARISSRASMRTRSDTTPVNSESKEAETVAKLWISFETLSDFHPNLFKHSGIRAQVLLEDMCSRTELLKPDNSGKPLAIRQKLSLAFPSSSSTDLWLEITSGGDDPVLFGSLRVDIGSLVRLESSDILLTDVPVPSTTSKETTCKVTLQIELEMLKHSKPGTKRASSSTEDVTKPEPYSRRVRKSSQSNNSEGDDEEKTVTLRIKNKVRAVKASMSMLDDVMETDLKILTPNLFEVRSKPPSKVAELLKGNFPKIKLYALSMSQPSRINEVNSKIINSGKTALLPRFQALLDFWSDIDTFFSEECKESENGAACFISEDSSPSPHFAMMLGSCLLAEGQVEEPERALAFALNQMDIAELIPSQLRYMEYFSRSLQLFLRKGESFPTNIHTVHLTQLAINPLPDVSNEPITLEVLNLDSEVLFSKKLTDMKVTKVDAGARIYWGDHPLELTGDLVVQMLHPDYGRLFSCCLHTAFIVDKRLVLRKEDLDYVDHNSESPLPSHFKIGLYFLDDSK